MGYFDNIVNQSKTDVEIEILKKELKQLFQKRLDVYHSLEQSPNYSKCLQLKKDEVIEQFKSFFGNKGFKITSKRLSTMHGENGAKASVGDAIIELAFENNKEFSFNVRGTFSSLFSLEDQKPVKLLFSGFEYEDDLILHGSYADDSYENLLRAKEDLKKDIAAYQKRIDERYKPEIHISTDKDSSEYNNFIDFLEKLNKELK